MHLLGVVGSSTTVSAWFGGVQVRGSSSRHFETGFRGFLAALGVLRGERSCERQVGNRFAPVYWFVFGCRCSDSDTPNTY